MARVEEIAACRPAGMILREKDLPEDEYRDLALQVMEVCKKYGTRCILHNLVGAASALHAEAIHLPLAKLLQMSEEEKAQFTVIGASCHSVEDAVAAQAAGCTYITAGHVFDTDCKRGLPGRGLSFLREVCESVTIPVYAIGGISPENIREVRAAGAKGACVMSGTMRCEDPRNYLQGFKEKQNMKFNREMLRLYAVTDRAWVGRQTLYEQIEDALKGGVTLVQLREKDLDEQTFVEEAVKVRELCHRYQVPLIINDNPEVAQKSGADGVHVGIEDAPVAEIRSKYGSDFIIGATAKTVEQARLAEASGADYLGVGAIFPSPTKTNAVRITREELKAICSSVAIPSVAIGGIQYENVDEIRGGDVDGIAVVSAIFAAENIREATARLKEKVNVIIEEKE